MEFKISKVRHPKEKFYGTLMLIIGSVGWVIAATVIVFTAMNNPADLLVTVLYIVVLWFVGYVTRALLRAHMLGHYVMVGPQQFPHIHQMVVEGARLVGLKEAPQTFVYNSSGVMNAMALKLIGRTRYVWLTSQLIDADNDEQLKFVIGHELGHHAAGHLDRLSILLHMPAHIIPFLGKAYSRGRELTCDRVGFLVSRNLQASRTALQMLASGSARLNSQMNPAAFEAQERMMPPIAGFILHIVSPYPRLSRRVEALGKWAPSLGNSSAPQIRDPGMRIEPQLA
ncbi:peptidase [Neorhizobium sp. P12A]|uniref:M48 family metallopeptidase n=1 Tax=Rhizobium/Agrobacterium group TaxID=227290 RepID=UPI00104AA7EE|nr:MULTISPECIES: M48 family metallopeptidase [Rhizobium/Agrobacterium group]KAA0698410.1 peptidase [Neorhizobium sp. P12A]TCR92801.1 Zn-dependent protease with chaperone function [Rhizobium sp. BK376]